MQLTALILPFLLALPSTLAAPAESQFSKRAISQEDYNELYRAVRFSKAAYQDNCARPLGFTKELTIRNSRYDTDGYIVKDTGRKEIVVAFRGTSGLQDAIIDMRNKLVAWTSEGSQGCSGCKVHQGFQQQWNAVQSAVLSKLRSLVAANPDYTILVTGHSLGGALSTLAGVSIERAFPGGRVRGIGFASPRVGNGPFAEFVNNAFGNRYARVTHTADNVPQDLTPAEGYQAVATEYWISQDPASPSTIVKCNGGEDPKCNNSVGKPNQGLAGINADHFLYFFNFRTEQVPCS